MRERHLGKSSHQQSYNLRGSGPFFGGRVRAAVALCVALTATACQDTNLLTGVYHSTAPVVSEDVTGWEQGVWIEMVLGHYGPDVAGLLRFYSSNDFLTTVEGIRNCVYVEKGEYDPATSELTIRFSRPDLYGSPDKSIYLGLKLLTHDGGDELGGVFGPSDSLDSADTVASFKREENALSMSDSDKICSIDVIGITGESDSGGDL